MYFTRASGEYTRHNYKHYFHAKSDTSDLQGVWRGRKLRKTDRVQQMHTSLRKHSEARYCATFFSLHLAPEDTGWRDPVGGYGTP